VPAQAFAEVVQRADFEVAVAQTVIPQGVAHLKVEAGILVELGVAPSKACFQGFQPNQHIHRPIGARWLAGVQNRKGFLMDAAEEFTIKCAGPRIRQSGALLFGQFAGGADERGLLVFGVCLEHAPIVVNFPRFEEGWLPFVQWSHFILFVDPIFLATDLRKTFQSNKLIRMFIVSFWSLFIYAFFNPSYGISYNALFFVLRALI
jgi:hypothetical protein